MTDTPGAGGPILAVRLLDVQFGSLAAVRNVGFDLRGGDLLGLIGPNGAGKTTLLRSIAGLQETTRGTVQVLGESVGPGKDSLRQVGFTPDTPPFYENLTVRQFLRFIGMGYGLSARETNERIDFWLEKVWLGEKADAKIKGLSRGMRQRIGIARTLLPNPALVLLDEPAAGLDPAGRVQFRQLLVHLRQQGKALIVSSHILADMEEYCTHMAIMAAGQMMQFGTVAEVSAHGDGTRRHYTIELARPATGLSHTLNGFAGVTHIDANGDRATIEFFSEKTRAAELLSQLIAAGLPVASFSANAAGLEEAYLRAGVKQVD